MPKQTLLLRQSRRPRPNQTPNSQSNSQYKSNHQTITRHNQQTATRPTTKHNPTQPHSQIPSRHQKPKRLPTRPKHHRTLPSNQQPQHTTQLTHLQQLPHTTRLQLSSQRARHTQPQPQSHSHTSTRHTNQTHSQQRRSRRPLTTTSRKQPKLPPKKPRRPLPQRTRHQTPQRKRKRQTKLDPTTHTSPFNPLTEPRIKAIGQPPPIQQSQQATSDSHTLSHTNLNQYVTKSQHLRTVQRRKVQRQHNQHNRIRTTTRHMTHTNLHHPHVQLTSNTIRYMYNTNYPTHTTISQLTQSLMTNTSQLHRDNPQRGRHNNYSHSSHRTYPQPRDRQTRLDTPHQYSQPPTLPTTPLTPTTTPAQHTKQHSLLQT